MVTQFNYALIELKTADTFTTNIYLIATNEAQFFIDDGPFVLFCFITT